MFQEQAPPSVLKFALRERVSGASSLVCTGWGTYPGACFGSVFQEQASSCVLVGVLTRERVSGACFRSKLPRVYRPLKWHISIGKIIKMQANQTYFEQWRV